MKTKYRPDFPKRVEHLLKWDNLTHTQAAKALGISKQTFYIYVDKYPDFRDAVKRGTESINEKIENALFKRAIGYKEEDDEIVESKMRYEFTGEVDRSGKAIKILIGQDDHIKKIKRRIPPSETAAIFLLTNRKNSKYKRNPDLFQDDKSIQTVDFNFINVNEYAIIPEIELFRHQIQLIRFPEKFKALVAGYGSGKTHGGACWALSRIRDRKGKGLIGVYAPTYRLMEDVNMPEMRNFLNRYKIPFHEHKEHKKFILTGELRGEIWFRSMDDPNKLIGYETTDTWLDEFDTLKPHKQKQIWTAIIQRNRKVSKCGGENNIIITTTPEGFRYTYELVQNGTLKHIKAKTDDNIYLPDSYIENFVSQFDDIRIQQARYGEFVNLNGLAAYYAFDQKRHVTPSDVLSEFPTHLHCGMDFNVAPMTAVVGYTKDKISRYGKEYYVMDSNTYQLSEALLRDFPNNMIAIRPDMTGNKRASNARIGITDHKILQQAGFRIEGSYNPAERDRLNMVNWAFSHNKIVINKDMVHLINDLNQCTVNEAGALRKKDNEMLTHISDALGYDIYQQYFNEYFDYKVYQG